MVTDPFFSPERQAEIRRKDRLQQIHRAMTLDADEDLSTSELKELRELLEEIGTER